MISITQDTHLGNAIKGNKYVYWGNYKKWQFSVWNTACMLSVEHDFYRGQ